MNANRRTHFALLISSVLATAFASMPLAGTASPDGPPPAVVLATNSLIKGWEGLVLESHWDRYAKIWDICYGETQGITAGMKKTKAECDEMLKRRVYSDYYLPLRKKSPGFVNFPVSVQATMVSGAYNFGVGAMINSSAVRLARQGKWREACEAQTAFNSWIDRWLADREFVTREEFEAVREMAIKARAENAALQARLDALEGKGVQGAATGADA